MVNVAAPSQSVVVAVVAELLALLELSGRRRPVYIPNHRQGMLHTETRCQYAPVADEDAAEGVYSVRILL